MLDAGVWPAVFIFAALGLTSYYPSLGGDNIPGPLLHRFSSLPKTYHLLKGDLPSHVAKLHTKYGSLVRIAPNELAFTDPVAWRDIYGHPAAGEAEFGKHPDAYHPVKTIPASIVSSLGREEHGLVRRRLSHGFSDKYLRSQEPIIREYVDLLIRKLREKAAGSDTMRVDICEWLNWTTFDIIGDLVLGGPFGCLESCSYHPWVRMVTTTLRLNTYLQVLAGMGAKRLVQWISNSSVLKAREQSRALVAEKLAKRLELTEPRPDFIDSLVRNSAEGTMSFPQLAVNASALTIAGSETTATLLSGAIFLLATNFRALSKLLRVEAPSFHHLEGSRYSSVRPCLPTSMVIHSIHIGSQMGPPETPTIRNYICRTTQTRELVSAVATSLAFSFLLMHTLAGFASSGAGEWIVATLIRNASAGRFIVALVIAALVVPAMFRALRNLHSPICAIPGPLLNKASPWPLFLTMLRGTSHHFTHALHEQYGPVVVLAPGTISVSNATEIKRIIQTADWPKSVAVYGKFRRDPDRPTLFAATDRKGHARRKRIMSSMFGIKHVRDMEPLMRECVQAAVTKLTTACDAARGGVATVDVQHLLQSVALDIMGTTTFGGSFHITENGGHPLPQTMKAGMKFSVIARSMPGLAKLRLLPTVDGFLNRFTSDMINNRRRKNLESSPPRRDLLQKFVEVMDESPGSALRFSDVQHESILLLTAGSETTANAELFTLINLPKHPEMMRKVHAEVDAWYPQTESGREATCAHSQTGMTYLRACFDETMRLSPGQATGSAREAPRDESILGYSVPKGTTVLPNTQGAHHDEALWPEPGRFTPERWLEIYERSTVNELPFWPFSAGSRVCLCKHFALQEMHLTLVMLLRHFDFTHVPGQDERTVYRVAQQLRAPKYIMKVTRRMTNRTVDGVC